MVGGEEAYDTEWLGGKRAMVGGEEARLSINIYDKQLKNLI